MDASEKTTGEEPGDSRVLISGFLRASKADPGLTGKDASCSTEFIGQ